MVDVDNLLYVIIDLMLVLVIVRASVYIHAGIYGQDSIIRSFQYASGSDVVQKTWADYGGVQKFVNSSKQGNDQQVYVLDGQGFVWTGGKTMIVLW